MSRITYAERSATVACAAVMLFGAWSVPAEDQSQSSEEKPGQIANEEASDKLPEITVTASRENTDERTLGKRKLQSGRPAEIAEIIRRLPGVHGVHRAASNAEPVIRGLGWERIATQVNGMPLHGACPSRMDPPVTFIRSSNTESLQIVTALPSVLLGPGGTGGRIIATTDFERDPRKDPALKAWAQLGYDSAREGRFGQMGVEGGNDRLDFRIAADGMDFTDYESPEEVEVPADQENWGASASVGFRPLEGHRFWNTFSFLKEERVDYPALPMNTEFLESLTYNTGYRMDLDGALLRQFKAEFGIADVDHLMTNRERGNRPNMAAGTPTKARTWFGKLQWTFDLRKDLDLAGGFDGHHLSRDALRTRFVRQAQNPQMVGRTFREHIWPEVTQWNAGSYAELNYRPCENHHFRFGGRVDHFFSDARDVEDPTFTANMMAALQGNFPSVRDGYVDIYGPGAADVSDRGWIGSANVLYENTPFENFAWNVGAGVTSRSPSATERYFSFGPAPGGLQVGNPALDSERKYELAGGLRYRNSWFEGRLSAYHNWFDDYILQTRVGDAVVMGSTQIIRGFRNIQARTYGVDGEWTFKPLDRLSVPMTFAWVRGQNDSDHRHLPEIPAMEGTVAIRWDEGKKIPWFVEFGTRLVAGQDDIDRAFPEDATAGYQLFHFTGGADFHAGKHVIRLEAGIDNLFDQDYNDHLSREALNPDPSSDLREGDEIPGIGRTFWIKVRWEF